MKDLADDIKDYLDKGAASWTDGVLLLQRAEKELRRFMSSLANEQPDYSKAHGHHCRSSSGISR